MKRIIALLLIIATVLTFASCNKKAAVAPTAGTTTVTEETPVMKCGSTEIDYGVFYTQMYTTKNDFLFNYLGAEADDPAIWSQDSPTGRLETMGEAFTRMVLEEIVQFAWVVEYAKDNGAVLTEEDNADVEESYNKLKEELGTEEAYREYLATFKFTDESLKKYYEQMVLYSKGFTLLVSENGLYPINDSDYDKYFEENFYTTKHIFINNVSKEDENGNPILLTEEEKKAQNEKADKIYTDLKDGTSFDVLYLLSEDEMAMSYPDGITFTDGMIEDYNYVESAKALKPGGYTKVDGVDGGIYIVMRCELNYDEMADYEAFIADGVESKIQSKIYSDHSGEVTVNYDVVNLNKVENIPTAG